MHDPRPISRRGHAATDYSYVPTVMAAPSFVGFEDVPVAARLARTYAGIIATSTFFTRAEWGVVPVMPYRYHVTIDAAVGAAALASPWVFGFERHERARNTFVVMGLVGLAVGLLSEPAEGDAPRQNRPAGVLNWGSDRAGRYDPAAPPPTAPPSCPNCPTASSSSPPPPRSCTSPTRPRTPGKS